MKIRQKRSLKLAKHLWDDVEERLEFNDKGVAPRKNVDVMKEVLESHEKKSIISLWYPFSLSLLRVDVKLFVWWGVFSLLDEGEVKAVEASEKKKKKEKRKTEEKDEGEDGEKSNKKKKKMGLVHFVRAYKKKLSHKMMNRPKTGFCNVVVFFPSCQPFILI